MRVPPLIALGASLRASVPEAAPVGFGVSGSRGDAAAGLDRRASAIWPATGSTSFGRGLGSGAISSCFGRLDAGVRGLVRAAAGERGDEQEEDQRAADQKLVLLVAPALVRPMWM